MHGSNNRLSTMLSYDYTTVAPRLNDYFSIIGSFRIHTFEDTSPGQDFWCQEPSVMISMNSFSLISPSISKSNS
jgi:hypothetical protein